MLWDAERRKAVKLQLVEVFDEDEEVKHDS